MVVTSTGLNNAKSSALNFFDNFTYMGIGTSNKVENPSDTTMGNEVVRDLIDEVTKSLGPGTYDFECSFELSDASGQTLREVAIFDASTGGNMGIRKILPVQVNKTDDEELVIKLRVSVNTENG